VFFAGKVSGPLQPAGTSVEQLGHLIGGRDAGGAEVGGGEAGGPHA